jgi:hypothetical protein
LLALPQSKWYIHLLLAIVHIKAFKNPIVVST